MIIPFSMDDTHQEEDGSRPSASNPYIQRIALVGGLGSLLFGLDTGIISTALISIGSHIGDAELTASQQSIVVSATTLTALLSSMIAGTLADWIGRKKVLMIASVFFALGSVEQSAAQVLKELVLGRLIVGLGVGLASMVIPLYLAEISPPNLRGRLVASLVVLITGGQVLAYVVGAIFYNVSHGWRWMFLFCAFPAIAQLLLSFTIPESPSYQIAKGKTTDARRTIALIYPNLSAEAIEAKIRQIEAALDTSSKALQIRVALSRPSLDSASSLLPTLQSGSTSIDKLWRDLPTRRALIVACGLQFYQQATGFNSLMYFSATLLKSAGFAQPAAFAIFIAVSNWICTIMALRLIDRVGRRKILLQTIIGLFSGLFLVSFFFLFIPKAEDQQKAGFASYLMLFSMIIFCSSYALGLGNVPWIMQSEIFAYEVRGVANSISTSVNWLANLFVAATFLNLTQLITASGTFALYGVLGLSCWVFCYQLVPETAGLSIEECQKLFEHRRPGLTAQKGDSAGEYEVVSNVAEQ